MTSLISSLCNKKYNIAIYLFIPFSSFAYS